MQPAEAPPASQVPAHYAVLTPGCERTGSMRRAGRAPTASGALAIAARLALAACVLGGLLALTAISA